MFKGNQPTMPFTGVGTEGLTKREHFACLAMQSWIANYGTGNFLNSNAIACAREAVAFADAILSELENGND